LLQFQRDAIQMRLMDQIGQLQSELIRLTKVETEKKAMKMEVEQVFENILDFVTLLF